MNSLQFLSSVGKFFAIFNLSGWILCIFHPSRVNFFHFSSFEGEFFTIFTLYDWILCVFHSSWMNSLQFPPLRVNSLQFSPFKGEFFAIFFFLRFFWVKRTKNYSGNGEFFKILIFYFSDWSFSIFNSAFSFPTISSLFLEVKMQIIYEFLTRVYTAHPVYSIPYEYFRCCQEPIKWSLHLH